MYFKIIMAEVEKHRPGIFKQPNKSHKTGRHRSKGFIHKETKGKSGEIAVSRKQKASVDRLQRRNQVNYLRKLKRDEVLKEKRNRGSAGTPPFLVAVVALSSDVKAGAVLDILKSCDGAVVSNSGSLCHISLPKFRQRFEFICPAYGDTDALLDAAKVADCLLLTATASSDIDSYAERSLSCLFTQGLPACILCLQGLSSLPIKKQSDVRKGFLKQLEKWFSDSKVHSIDTAQDAALLLRAVSTQKLNKILLREYRPNLIATAAIFEPTGDQGGSMGTLKVSGYLRGQSLSANSLVHIPGFGDFQLSQIDAPDDPHPIMSGSHIKDGKRAAAKMDSEDIGDGVRVLERSNPEVQASLQSEAVVNSMDAEQTWPTDEELAAAEAKVKLNKKIVKRVPKGTSEYQAAWIIDSDEEETSDNDDDDDDDDTGDAGMMDAEAAEGPHSSDESASGSEDESEEEEKESIVISGADDRYDETVDMAEEANVLEKYRAAHTEQMFPDEVETPMDTPARIRFQKYRGLKSFRTSPWDPLEDLPADYARIFRFENFAKTRKRVLQSAIKSDHPAKPGMFVTLHITNVPRDVFDVFTSGRPLVVFGMLEHEQKMSVVHLLVKRYHDDTDDEPIKSKEQLTFHIGYRRFTACPVYSQHTNMNKHKFERFMPQEGTAVATIFAPILFPPASVLMFKQKPHGDAKLVASGFLMSVNPDRIVTKRIVLSGHPLKINRKHAVIRYLFFNREDIMWFKPVELRTKWGRHGHIKEPLGTHGHMKCVFDGQLKSQDTILMNLYKRIYPKWTYCANVRPLTALELPDGADAMFD